MRRSRYSEPLDLDLEGRPIPPDRPLGTVDMATGEWTPPPGTLGVADLPPGLRSIYEREAWDELGQIDPRTGNWIQGGPRRWWQWWRRSATP